MSKVWLITGIGCGMGVNIAKAVGKADNLLVVKLDVTNPEDAHAQLVADHVTRITKETRR